MCLGPREQKGNHSCKSKLVEIGIFIDRVVVG